ncbi:fructose-bisphosphatase class I [Helicobacter aurati]|uniref:Fructose-1,6-bisphosphatase class 1 n=1 Tax=Helicobacter aurati TaxID=137778 RepID=A0A3D8J1C8_9HELI|nr:class 1 fructose-bisphosphatase [Helicobacter aurati]RDU71030.1 fructose-bisphosphatase class I [Helicobacter aurati]
MQSNVCSTSITESVSQIIEALKQGALQLARLLETREIQYSSHANASGDNQLQIDIAADNLFGKILSSLSIKGFASEEREGVVLCDMTCFQKFDSNLQSDDSLQRDKQDNILQGALLQELLSSNVLIQSSTIYTLTMQDLLVAFDPLDGSSLMDSNLSIGSIFGIYAHTFAPQNLIASLYFLYGPRLELVVAKDSQSLHYLYNPSTGTWHFIQELKLQQKGKINATGGTQKYWDIKHFELVQSFFREGYRLRYSGGMVPDLHQILCKGGGIFSYPATSDSPTGKLRKLFEVYPFALIFEYAGGGAIDGKTRLLDGDVKSIHESTPCFFGSHEEIQRVREFV